MAEATDGLSAVVNAATQLVKEEAIHVGCSRDAGGTFSFFLSCEKSVVKTLCVTGVTLYGMYTASKLLARAIDGIVNKGLEGHRTDQGICAHINQTLCLLDIHDNLKYKQTKFFKRKDLLYYLSEDLTYRFLCLTELLCFGFYRLHTSFHQVASSLLAWLRQVASSL